MTFERIVSYVVLTFTYTGLFSAVLTWLGVKEKRFIRGLLLASVLILADIAALLATGLTSQTKDNFAIYATVIVLIFYLIIRKLLVLKTWQYAVIPLGVYIVGQVILIITLLIFSPFMYPDTGFPVQWISPLFNLESLIAAALALSIEIFIVLFFLSKKNLKITPLALVLIVVNIISVVIFIFLPSAMFYPYPVPDNLYYSGIIAVLFETFILKWASNHAYLKKPNSEQLRFISVFFPILIANIIFIVCIVNIRAILLQS